MDRDQITEDERRQLAEKRKQIRRENAQRFAGLRDFIVEQRKETIEMMRRRHAHYTKLINDGKIKTAQEFFIDYCA